MMLDLIRSLINRGEVDEARRAREVLGRGEAPRTRAFAEVADGLMAEDPNDAVRLLGEACASLKRSACGSTWQGRCWTSAGPNGERGSTGAPRSNARANSWWPATRACSSPKPKRNLHLDRAT